MPYAEFHTGYKQKMLARDELVDAILLPQVLRPLRVYP